LQLKLDLRKRKALNNKKHDAKRPVRPRNAFVLYKLDVWQRIKTENPTFKQKELLDRLGTMWRSLNKEEKQAYK